MYAVITNIVNLKIFIGWALWRRWICGVSLWWNMVFSWLPHLHLIWNVMMCLVVIYII